MAALSGVWRYRVSSGRVKEFDEWRGVSVVQVCPHSVVWRSVSCSPGVSPQFSLEGVTVVQDSWRLSCRWRRVVGCGLGVCSIPKYHSSSIFFFLLLLLLLFEVTMTAQAECCGSFWPAQLVDVILFRFVPVLLTASLA